MELTFKLSELREVTRIDSAGEQVKITENVYYDMLNEKGENVGNINAHTNGFTVSMTTPVGPSFKVESLLGQIRDILSDEAE